MSAPAAKTTETTSAVAELQSSVVADTQRAQTLWGLTPHQLHDRYWAAHGVQVVRVGQPSELVPRAELFLLTDPRTLVLFPLDGAIEDFNWLKPNALYLRIKDRRDRTYREFVQTDADGRFLGFRRAYDGDAPQLGRVVLTPHRDLADCWRRASSVSDASRTIRRAVHVIDRGIRSVEGGIYDGSSSADTEAFLRQLQLTWRTPESTIPRAKKISDGVYADSDMTIPAGSTVVPPLWIGAGRRAPEARSIVGPAALFDDPHSRPPPPEMNWQELTTMRGQHVLISAARAGRRRPLYNFCKRVFDILFATAALLGTLPLYPLIMAAIWLEDGRPFFFAHKRETRGGKVFGCIKFRSMRKDAEKIKAQLAKVNQADGPQFFMEHDPRISRVGAFLRKYNLDELPQFWNVLTGDMSVVGPRPSPYAENQYCPPWREARLSVRPGITGLWQVSRTRRAGCDFQEWIKFDLKYVENASFLEDLRIIYQTIAQIFRKAGQS